MSFTDSALLASGVAIALLGFALAGLVRQVRVLSSSRPAPSLDAPNTGRRLPSELLTAQAGRHIFLFVKPNCEVCEQRLEEFDTLALEYPGVACTALFSEARNGFQGSNVKVFSSQSRLLEDLVIPVAPYGMVTASDGTILGSGAVGSAEELRRLVARAAEGADA